MSRENGFKRVLVGGFVALYATASFVALTLGERADAAGGPDLAVQIAATSGPFLVAGEQATFDVTVRNLGDTATPASGVSVSTTIPGASIDSRGGTGWSCSLTACTYAPAIAAGGTAAALQIVATMPFGATGTAHLSATVAVAGDTNAANDVGSIDMTYRPGLILTPTFTAPPGSVYYDEPATFTAGFRNTGAHDITGPVHATVTPYSGAISAASGPGWTCTAPTEEFSTTWTCDHAGPLAVDAALPTLSFSVLQSTPVFGDAFTVATNVSSDDGAFGTATATVALHSRVDLRPTITASPASFTFGGSGSFVTTVHNDGIAFDAPVTVTVNVSDGWTASGTGWSCAPTFSFGQIACSRSGPVAAGPSTLPAITATGPVPLSYDGTTTASATVATAADKAQGNDGATITVPVASPVDFAITMGAGPATGIVGTPFSVPVHVRNNGTTAANGVEVDVSVSDADAVTVAGSGWSCGDQSGSFVCVRSGSIPNGALPDLTVTASPDGGFFGDSSASVYAYVVSAEDGRLDNNSADVTVPTLSPTDLSVSGPTDLVSVDVGGTAHVPFTVKDVGANAAPGPTTVTGTADDGLPISNASGPGWDCTHTPTTFTCTTAADLAAGGALPPIDVAVTTSTASYPTKYVSATVARPGDGVSFNDTGYGGVQTTGLPDVYVAIDGSTQLVTGVAVPTLFVVGNRGTVAAPAPVKLDVTVAAGTTVADGTYDGWACAQAGTAVHCTNATPLVGNTSVALHLPIRAASDAPTSIPVTATATATGDPSFDQSTTNLFVARAINLTVAQQAPASIRIGDPGHLQLTVFNTGGLDASGPITVTDTLPTRLTATAAAGTGWSCTIAGRTVTCTRSATIARNDTAPDITIDVVASAGAAVTVQNQATVQVAGDGSAADDTSLSHPIDLVAASVSGDLSGNATGGYLVEGTNGSLTVELGNTGTSPFTPTVVVDPKGAATLGASLTAGWTCSGTGPATCTRSSQLGAGATDRFAIGATAGAPPADGTADMGFTLREGTADLATHTTAVVVLAAAAPHAVLSSDAVSGTAPLAVHLSGRASSGAFTRYSLDFGDGTAFTSHDVSGAADIPDATHTYAAVGVYRPLLTVSDGFRTHTASIAVVVSPPIPAAAHAGDDQTANAGEEVSFDGSASTGATGPDAYHWDFGDGASATGATASHVYTAQGTYTARLRVDVDGGGSVADTATVTVLAKPDDGAVGLVATVHDAAGHGVGNATVVIELSNGSRRTATTSSGGNAKFTDLPDGTYQVFAAVDDRLGEGTAVVHDGDGTATLVVKKSPFGVASLDTKALTRQEIIDAGIDPDDPANNRVTHFTVALGFLPDQPGVTTPFCGNVNADGEFVGTTGSGCGATGGWSCSVTCSSGFGGGGGGAGGGTVYAVPGVVADEPTLFWLIIPGDVHYLKQFWQVTMAVTNLGSQATTFTNGAASLALPDGLSLAPTATAQSTTNALADVAGGETKQTTWIIRGDTPGSYDLQASYHGRLDPIGVPVALSARTLQPVVVSGANDLKIVVDAADHAYAGYPYDVRLGLRNDGATTVYNASITVDLNAADDFDCSPGETDTRYADAVPPGGTVWFDNFIYFPQQTGTLQIPDSWVAQAGGKTFGSERIGSHPTAVTPDTAYAIDAVGDAGGSTVTWGAVPGATGYKVFLLDALGVCSGHDQPLAEVGGSTTSTHIALTTDAEKTVVVRTQLGNGSTIVHPYVLVSRLRDTDGDGVLDVDDNCISIPNSDQADTDGDGKGDACDDVTDRDKDGVGDSVDNCPDVKNADQKDWNADHEGDACDVLDTDGDGFSDVIEHAYGSDPDSDQSRPVVPGDEIADPLSRTAPDIDCAAAAVVDPCALQPGDIILWRSTGAMAFGESIATGHSYYSHSLIVLGRWRVTARDDPRTHVEVMVADITPGRDPAELGAQTFSTTDASTQDEDAHPSVGVFRPLGPRHERETAARIALTKILDEGGSSPANQNSSGWYAPGVEYAMRPGARGPDQFYCSSFVAWAYRNVKSLDSYDDEQINPWISPDDLLNMGVKWISGYGPIGGGSTVYSPAHVMITDPQGRRAGRDPSGVDRAEIPGAQWYHLDDRETVTAPNFGPDWTVTLSGFGTGDYHLQTHAVTADGGFVGGAMVPGTTHPGLVETFHVGDQAATTPLGHHDVPVASDDTVTTSVGTTVDVDVLANDVDGDDGIDPATLTIVAPPVGGTATVVDGKIRYTAGGGAGTDPVTYEVSDRSGHSSRATLVVTIEAPPDPKPPVAAPDALTVPEDGAGDVDVLANDSDPDGDLAPSSLQLTTPAQHGTVTVGTAGAFHYVPAADFNGPDSFAYRVCDAGGRCSTATVGVTVTPVADPPVARDDTASSIEDAPVDVAVLANDADVDGDLLASSVGVTTAPAHGTATAGVNGVVRYAPTAGFAGTDSFAYRVCDAAGLCASATVTTTATASPPPPPVGHPPTAVDDTARTKEDTAVDVAVLANDTDADGDLVASSVRIETAPGHGSTTPSSSGVVRYVPAPDSNGTDSFRYTVCDAAAHCATAKVTVTVTAVADPPVARDDTATTDQRVAVTVDVLANDTDADGDLSRSTLKIVKGPGHGQASVTKSGTVRYTPDGRSRGIDTFRYQVCDAGKRCAQATVSITVTGLPRLTITSTAVREGSTGTTPVTLTVRLDQATDHPVTVDWATLAGTASGRSDYVAGSGTLTFAPGETEQTVTVAVVGDRTREHDELFAVRLTNAAGATIGGLGLGGIVILDDDGAHPGPGRH